MKSALFFLFKDNVKSLNGSQEYVTSWSLGDSEEKNVLSSLSSGKKAFVHLEGVSAADLRKYEHP